MQLISAHMQLLVVRATPVEVPGYRLYVFEKNTKILKRVLITISRLLNFLYNYILITHISIETVDYIYPIDQ